LLKRRFNFGHQTDDALFFVEDVLNQLFRRKMFEILFGVGVLGIDRSTETMGAKKWPVIEVNHRPLLPNAVRCYATTKVFGSIQSV
jgi:hypothetical protein